MSGVPSAKTKPGAGNELESGNGFDFDAILRLVLRLFPSALSTREPRRPPCCDRRCRDPGVAQSDQRRATRSLAVARAVEEGEVGRRRQFGISRRFAVARSCEQPVEVPVGQRPSRAPARPWRNSQKRWPVRSSTHPPPGNNRGSRVPSAADRACATIRRRSARGLPTRERPHASCPRQTKRRGGACRARHRSRSMPAGADRAGVSGRSGGSPAGRGLPHRPPTWGNERRRRIRGYGC